MLFLVFSGAEHRLYKATLILLGHGFLLLELPVVFFTVYPGHGYPNILSTKSGIQSCGGVGEEPVVEVHQIPETSPVAVKVVMFRFRELGRHIRGHQFPVGTPETVDALFDIADKEVVKTL